MAQYANTSAVPLSMAVFLATDHYDYDDDPNTISATSLLKPVRQLVLSARVPQQDVKVELINLLASRMGTAIHNGIEWAWTKNHVKAMQALGYPQRVIDRVVINPMPQQLAANPDLIPVYMEQRKSRQVGKWKVTGKFDFVGEGRVEDFKTTTTFTAINSTNDEKYAWQGSIYRWLSPDIITQSEIAIQFIFTDWNKAKALSDPKYPQQRMQQRLIPLKPLLETDAFVKRKLQQIEAYWDAPEDEIPPCGDEDLWRSDPVFKYYKNPAKTGRSTKNFETQAEAMLRYVQDGSVGIVKEVPGQVTACKYCPAFAACTQKDALIASGDLVLT